MNNAKFFNRFPMISLPKIAQPLAKTLGALCLYGVSKSLFDNPEITTFLTSSGVSFAPVILERMESFFGEVLPGKVEEFTKECGDCLSYGYNHDLDKLIEKATTEALRKTEKDIVVHFSLPETDKNNLNQFIQVLEVTYKNLIVDEKHLDNFIHKRAKFLGDILTENNLDDPEITSVSLDEIYGFFFEKMQVHLNHYFLEEIKRDEKAQTAYFVHLLELSARVNRENTALLQDIAQNLKGLEKRALGNTPLLRSIALAQQTTADILKTLHADFKIFTRDFDEFKKLVQNLHEPALLLPRMEGKTNNQQRYDFRLRYTTFVGRETEMQQLWHFLTDEPQQKFKWWLLTGSGGMGKSRLAFEWCLEALHLNYHIGFLANDQIEKFTWGQWQPQLQTLIVIDYALTQNDKIIDTFLKNLSSRTIPLDKPVRVLLIDREAHESWLNSVNSTPEVSGTFEGKELTDYLQLSDNDENISWKIIEEVFRKAQKPITQAPDEILNNLRTIDPENRPLFAFFVGIALAEGVDISDWNIGKMLKYHLIRIEEHVWKKDTRWDENQWKNEGHLYKNLLALATLTRGLTPEQLKNLNKQNKEWLPAKIDKTRFEVLSHLNHKETPIYEGLQPDILGEYFVLYSLSKYEETECIEPIQDLFTTAWDLNGVGMANMTFLTHKDFSNKDFAQQEIIHKIFEQLVRTMPLEMSEAETWLFWAFAQSMINPDGINNVDSLEEITYQYIKKGIKHYPKSIAINVVLSSTLASLCNKEKTANATKYFHELTFLHRQFPDNQEIALRFAKGLLNMTTYRGSSEVTTTQAVLNQLASLHEEYRSNSEITVVLAQGLVNLINYDVANAQTLLSQLASLQKQYSENTEIRIELAKGFFNLITHIGSSDLVTAQVLLIQLASLQKQYSGNTEIAVLFAQSLFNLIIHISSSEISTAQTLLSQLASLQRQYRDDPEITILLAKGLANLIADMDISLTADAQTILSKLSTLHEQYPDNPEIMVELANGLFNLIALISRSNIETAHVLLIRLASIREQCPDNKEIRVLFAQALFNLIAHTGNSDIATAQGLLTQLASLHELYSDDSEITIALAKGMTNLISDTGKKNTPTAQTLLNRLDSLHIQYPNIHEIKVLFAKGLVNSMLINSNVAITQTLLNQLDSLHKQDTENPEITVQLAKGLGALLFSHSENLSQENISLYLGGLIQLANNHLDKVEVLSITVEVVEKIINQEGQIKFLPKYLLSLMSSHFQNQKWQEGFEYFEKLNKLYAENIENEALGVPTFFACKMALMASLQLNNQESAKSIFGNMQFMANKFDKNEEIQVTWQELLALI
jgi:hypothetical protein